MTYLLGLAEVHLLIGLAALLGLLVGFFLWKWRRQTVPRSAWPSIQQAMATGAQPTEVASREHHEASARIEELSGANADLQSRVMALSSRLERAEEVAAATSPPEIGTMIDLTDDAVEARARADALQARVDELSTQAADTTALRSRIQQLRAEADTASDLKARVTELESRLVEADAVRGPEADGLRHRVDELEAEVVRLRTVESEARNLQGVSARLPELEASVRQAEAEAATARKRVFDLEAKAARIPALEAQLREQERDAQAATRQPQPQVAGDHNDDLKMINGVGPKLEKTLHGLGIRTFAQIAELTPEKTDALQAQMPEFPGRIRRDNWIEQAQELHEELNLKGRDPRDVRRERYANPYRRP